MVGIKWDESSLKGSLGLLEPLFFVLLSLFFVEHKTLRSCVWRTKSPHHISSKTVLSPQRSVLLFLYLLYLLKTATVLGVVRFGGLIGSSCRVNWFQWAPKEETWDGNPSEGDASREEESPPLPFALGAPDVVPREGNSSPRCHFISFLAACPPKCRLPSGRVSVRSWMRIAIISSFWFSSNSVTNSNRFQIVILSLSIPSKFCLKMGLLTYKSYFALLHSL